MDISALVESFATGTYNVTRRAVGGWKRGVAEPMTTTTLAIRASVQPATGKDLLRLAEGRRTAETRVVFTATALLVGDEGGTNEADLVTIDGAVWEVQHVETWRQPGSTGVGYRCIVQAV